MNHNDRLILRPATLEDAPMLLAWESTPELGQVTQSQEKLSLEFICRHILSAGDLVADSQLRLIVTTEVGVPVGTVDLFEYDNVAATAEVGVYIIPQARRCGYASEALHQVIELAQGYGISELKAEVQVNNVASMALFRRLGFVEQSSGGPLPIASFFLMLK